MKINDDFTLRQVNKNAFLLEGKNEKNNSEKIITFNSTAAFLWTELSGKDFTLQDVEKILIDKYCLNQDCANNDAKHIIKVWTQSSLIK